jgi:hypothetical protein
MITFGRRWKPSQRLEFTRGGFSWDVCARPVFMFRETKFPRNPVFRRRWSTGLECPECWRVRCSCGDAQATDWQFRCAVSEGRW